MKLLVTPNTTVWSVYDDSILFVNIVQAGSFTQAALLLEISKAQLSRRIAKLEQVLNCVLFIRTPRGLHLTEQGQQYYQKDHGYSRQA